MWQVNGADVRRARGSRTKRMLSRAITTSVASVDLAGKGLGDRGAVEAVAAMLERSAATLTRLDLRSALSEAPRKSKGLNPDARATHQ